MDKPDGGPAFPFSALSPGGPDIYKDNEGMSLRDYFAGQALVGMLASDSSVDRTKVNKAVWSSAAYAFADAMLAERAK